MRVLFDNGTPRGIAAALQAHTVEEARARGWDMLRNGELLDAAERAGFDVFITTDRNIRYQQNLDGRRIAIVILGKGRWRLIRARLTEIANAVACADPAVSRKWIFRWLSRSSVGADTDYGAVAAVAILLKIDGQTPKN